MFQVNDNFQKLPGSYLFSNDCKKSQCIPAGKSGQEPDPSWVSVM